MMEINRMNEKSRVTSFHAVDAGIMPRAVYARTNPACSSITLFGQLTSMPKISHPTELKDAEVFLAAYDGADQLTVLWMSEHLFELLRSLFPHSTPERL